MAASGSGSSGQVDGSRYANNMVKSSAVPLTELDREILALGDSMLVGTNTYQRAMSILAEFMKIVREAVRSRHGIKAKVFGSYASGLAEHTSDLDVCLIVQDRDSKDVLADIQKAIPYDGGNGKFSLERVVWKCRVPIARLEYDGYLAVEVCVNNIEARSNSMLLSDLYSWDCRAAYLYMVVKRWLKINELYGASCGYLSSYSWSILVIFWLQAKGLVPPIKNESAWEPRAESFQPQFGNLGQLLIGFFYFYAKQFDWTKDVVSLYHGVPTSSQDQFFKFPKTSCGIRICDPLKPTRDLGDVLHYGSADTIQGACLKAYNMIKKDDSIKQLLKRKC